MRQAGAQSIVVNRVDVDLSTKKGEGALTESVVHSHSRGTSRYHSERDSPSYDYLLSSFRYLNLSAETRCSSLEEDETSSRLSGFISGGRKMNILPLLLSPSLVVTSPAHKPPLSILVQAALR